MQQAIAIRDDIDEQAEACDAGEVIDAFDHVLEALDEVYLALAEFAPPRSAEQPRFRAAAANRPVRHEMVRDRALRR
ncbi:MAG: hypothetical protein JWM58_4245 [Rhizobium sp.]|nr:hypothetical protein [Rhizobium sp.]